MAPLCLQADPEWKYQPQVCELASRPFIRWLRYARWPGSRQNLSPTRDSTRISRHIFRKAMPSCVSATVLAPPPPTQSFKLAHLPNYKRCGAIISSWKVRCNYCSAMKGARKLQGRATESPRISGRLWPQQPYRSPAWINEHSSVGFRTLRLPRTICQND